jgi:pseudouridine kinase
LLAEGVATVILKLGAAGVIVGHDDATRHLDAIPPGRVVDVTGAGDAFAAGFLYGSMVGSVDPAACGLAAASLTVESVYAVAEELSIEALQRRLSGADRSPPETGGSGVS